MTGPDQPEWLNQLTAAPLDRLFVWQTPRILTQTRPPTRTSGKRRHAMRWAHALSLTALAPARWIPFPDRPGPGPVAVGGRPGPDDYIMISWMLRHRPGRWAVVYVGDKSTAGAVRSAVIGQRDGFSRRGGEFDSVVRSAGGGMFQTHARFTPDPQ